MSFSTAPTGAASPRARRSRLRAPSLTAVALAAAVVLVTQGALVAHADDLETVPVAATGEVASAPAEALAEEAVGEPVAEPAVESAAEPASESAEPAVEPVVQAPEEASEPVAGTAEQAEAPEMPEALNTPDAPVAAKAPAEEILPADAAEALEPASPPVSLVENLPVVTNDDYFVIGPGETISLAAPGILGNDSDPEGDDFVAQQGSFTTWLGNTGFIGAEGQFGFTAAPGFSGTDTIEYYTQDAGHGGTLGTIFVTVQEQVDPTENHWPSPLADYYTTLQNSTLVIPAYQGVLANDIDDDGDAITTQAKTGMPSYAGGSVWIDADGSFGYTPPTGFIGNDSFSYIAFDTFGGASWSSVQIGVTAAGTVPGGPNLPPVAGDDLYTVADGSTLVVDAAHGVLLNDSDPDGGAVTLTPGTVTSQIGVQVDIAGDGSFAYTPKPGTLGDDYFPYTVTDEAGLTSTGYVSITITPYVPVDDPGTDPGTTIPVPALPTDPNLPVAPTTPDAPGITTVGTVVSRGDSGDSDQSDASGLALTGLHLWQPLGGAVGVLLLGAFGLIAARRRRRSH